MSSPLTEKPHVVRCKPAAMLSAGDLRELATAIEEQLVELHLGDRWMGRRTHQDCMAGAMVDAQMLREMAAELGPDGVVADREDLLMDIASALGAYGVQIALPTPAPHHPDEHQ